MLKWNCAKWEQCPPWWEPKYKYKPLKNLMEEFGLDEKMEYFKPCIIVNRKTKDWEVFYCEEIPTKAQGIIFFNKKGGLYQHSLPFICQTRVQYKKGCHKDQGWVGGKKKSDDGLVSLQSAIN